MIASLWNRLRCASLPRDVYRKSADQFLARLLAPSQDALPSVVGPRVGVVVVPWQRTAVPFYLIEWALRLRRDGVRVELIWDVWPNSPDRPTAEEATIARLLRAVSRRFDIPVVSPAAAGDSNKEMTVRLERLAFEGVTRELKREPVWGDPAVSTKAEKLRAHAGRVESFLAGRGYAWILLPGGVWAISGVYWEATQTQGIGVTTFDSGTGLLCFQHGGPAAHFPDLAPSMLALTEHCMTSPVVRRHVEDWVNNRLEIRRRGEDEFQLQPTGGRSSTGAVHILVPLNYRLDTAAMCRQRLFRSVNEWLHALVDWAVSHPDVVIVFRQHPCEKIPAYRSGEDYSWIPAAGANLRFIAAEDPVNTYDLIRSCRVVLPHSSRVGIEAAIFGKPVVLAASTYYETMPFASAPESPSAYFSGIEELLARPPEQTERERCAALAAYFVAENYGLYRTHFTPVASDFEIWARSSSKELWKQDNNEVFVRALIERRPAADLLLEKQIAAWEKMPK